MISMMNNGAPEILDDDEPRAPGITYHGDMICVAYVEGSDGLYALAASDQRVVGDNGAALGEVAWVVRDNSQGATAEPDEITFWAWLPAGVGKPVCENAAAVFVLDFIESLLMPIEAGNISVKTDD